MKTAGVNIVLGHTLGFCLAESATLPRSSVMVSVRSDQSVESGKSGYSAEVEAVGEFVNRSAAGECRVFILDEPFRTALSARGNLPIIGHCVRLCAAWADGMQNDV